MCLCLWNICGIGVVTVMAVGMGTWFSFLHGTSNVIVITIENRLLHSHGDNMYSNKSVFHYLDCEFI